MYSDNTLYKWLFNVEENVEIPDNIKSLFKKLVTDYRRDNGLSRQDPNLDDLLGDLRLAIQYDSDLVSEQGPAIHDLNEFFGFHPKSQIFKSNFVPKSILRLIYGLYRGSSTEFMLNNLGDVLYKASKNPVSKALVAVNKFCASKNFLTNFEINSLQKLMLLSSWYISDILGDGELIDFAKIEQISGINVDRFATYISGKTKSTQDLEMVDKIKDLITNLKPLIRSGQSILLEKQFKDFYSDNRKTFPGVHGVQLQYSSVLSAPKIDYSPDFRKPEVMAKHYVELLIRQGGMLPSGRYGEGADDYNIFFAKMRHHIDFYKPSIDVMNLIMLGNLHYKFTHLEGTKNLDYYSRMRSMRNGFQEAIPPSFWESKNQDIYIERLIEFVTEWDNNKVIQYTSLKTKEFINGQWVNAKIDFIKMNYKGTTYSLQEMINEGWVSRDFIEAIITDIKQKLMSRGLM